MIEHISSVQDCWMFFQGDCWWWRSLFWWWQWSKWQWWWPLWRWWRLKSLIVAARSEVYPGTLLETCNWGSRPQLLWWWGGYFGYIAYHVKECISIFKFPHWNMQLGIDIHSYHEDHDEGGGDIDVWHLSCRSLFSLNFCRFNSAL